MTSDEYLRGNDSIYVWRTSAHENSLKYHSESNLQLLCLKGAFVIPLLLPCLFIQFNDFNFILKFVSLITNSIKYFRDRNNLWLQWQSFSFLASRNQPQANVWRTVYRPTWQDWLFFIDLNCFCIVLCLTSCTMRSFFRALKIVYMSSFWNIVL